MNDKNKLPELLDEPPPRTTHHGAYGPYWRLLRDNPGRWAEYPGSTKVGATTMARQQSRDGVIFEGVRRGEKLFFRVRP